MKYKNKMAAVILTLACSLWVSDIFAVGIGVAGAVGSEKWVRDFNDHNGKREITSYGFIMDTNIAKDSVFGYRITVSRERNNAKNDIGIDLIGTSLTHDFAFAIHRSSSIKVWLGPQLKVGFYDTELNYNPNTNTNTNININTNINPNTNTNEYGSATTIAIGPVIGVNVHFAKAVSFSASFAYHIIGFASGDHNEGVYNFGADFDNGSIDADLSSSAYLNLAVMYRFGSDVFR